MTVSSVAKRNMPFFRTASTDRQPCVCCLPRRRRDTNRLKTGPSSPSAIVHVREVAATVRCADTAATAMDRCNKVRRQVLRHDQNNTNADFVLHEWPITEMSALEMEAVRAEQTRDERIACDPFTDALTNGRRFSILQSLSKIKKRKFTFIRHSVR